MNIRCKKRPGAEREKKPKWDRGVGRKCLSGRITISLEGIKIK